MSLSGQISLLAARAAAEIKSLTGRVTAAETSLVSTVNTSDPRLWSNRWDINATYRLGQVVISNSVLWMLANVEGSHGTKPPGPQMPTMWGGVYVNNPRVAASSFDADAIHGGCFRFLTAGQTIYRVHVSTLTPVTVNETLKMWIRKLSDPVPLDTDTPTASRAVWVGDTMIDFALTASPFVFLPDTDYVAWFGPTGCSAVNHLTTSASGIALIDPGGTDFAVPAAGEYILRHRGGVGVFQSGAALGFVLYAAPSAATQGLFAWRLALIAPSRAVQAYALNGAPLTVDDASAYRRIDITGCATPTTVTLGMPSGNPPGWGTGPTENVPTVTLRILTPVGVTPAPITWVNVAGASGIPIPAPGLYGVVSLEWIYADALWFVVGSDNTTVRLSADLSAVTLSGTAVLLDPSAFRRVNFTTGTAATTITLQNPAVYPAPGKALMGVTILLRTPAGVTPGAITWANLTGGASIPLPAASQVVSANIEWVDETVGWLVVGVRA